MAVGCTMVLKPSEIAPFSAQLWAEVLHAAGVPAGVFNLVNGDGPTVGAAIASHPEVDMVSFTGSTRAGIEVARNAAPTVKRVHQELGGKSPNIILRRRRLQARRHRRRSRGDEQLGPVVQRADAHAGAEHAAWPRRWRSPRQRPKPPRWVTPPAARPSARWSPTRSGTRSRRLIQKGIEEGATLVAGGPGKPEGLEKGYYVKPTVFADVNNEMTIAREEIFGPVLAILGYDTVEEAIAIANDTPYGLAAYVSGTDPEATRKVASRLRAGQVNLNSAAPDMMAPFGGYKQSGNGREWGDHAFAEFLEIKAILGFAPRAPA